MSRKIKVLHYGLSENKGGIENVVFSWLKNKPGDITFDFVNDTGNKLGYEDEFKNYGCHVYTVTHRYTNPIKHKNELKALIDSEKYDYIHCHVMTLIEPVEGMICENNSHCSAIYHCHSMYKGLKFPLKEKMLQNYTSIILNNKHIYRMACGKDAGDFMFKGKPFTVIENGVDFKSFSFNANARKEIRNKLSISDNEIVIGHVGHECFEKNYPFMFESFSKLIKENNSYKLLLIGNMDKSDWIKDLIKKYRIKNNVIFTGMVNNAKDFYSAMDLFYLPSVNEGFPVVLIEAQASGLPCVVSDRVTKDTKISNDYHFISLNIDDAVKIIKNIKLCEDRKNIILDSKYDVKNSSNKLFEFYRNNLKVKILD